MFPCGSVGIILFQSMVVVVVVVAAAAAAATVPLFFCLGYFWHLACDRESTSGK